MCVCVCVCVCVTSNLDLQPERTLDNMLLMFLVEKYRIPQKPTRKMSDFSLRGSDLVKACRTELTIHLRMC